MQPDILLQHATHGTIVLDVKWKRPHGRPAEADLRQLFAYAQHYGATQARLLYPQAGGEASVEGEFVQPLATAQGPRAIRSGISYVRVGQTADDFATPTHYLLCSLELELLTWLPREACLATTA